MCEMYGLPIVYSGDESNDENQNPSWSDNHNTTWNDEQIPWNSKEINIEDKVILETEITLRTGPNITMKIHEESRSNSALLESEEDSRKMGVIRVLTEDSESDFYEKSRKSPRKVRFGGEQVKMRTPESDSSTHTDNEDHNINKRIIDLTAVQNELSSVKITLTDAISIKTKKSLIPIPVTSLPASPTKKTIKQANNFTLKRRLYKSTPNLATKEAKSSCPSRIPKKKKENLSKTHNPKTIASVSSDSNLRLLGNQEYSKKQQENLQASENSKINKEEKPILSHGRATDVLSPVPIHNQIEILHNLSRSPERSRKNSLENESSFNISTSKIIVTNEDQIKTINQEDFKKKSTNYDSFQSVKVDETISNKKAEENIYDIISNNKVSNNLKEVSDNQLTESAYLLKKSYSSFKIYNSIEENRNRDSSVVIEEITDNTIPKSKEEDDIMQKSLQRSLSSLTSDDELWAKSEALDNVVKMLKKPETCEDLEAGPALLLLEALLACHHRDRLQNLADDALTALIKGLKPEILQLCLPRLATAVCKMGAPSGVRVAIIVMKKCPPKMFQNEVLEKWIGHRMREGALQVLLSCLKLFPSTDVEVQKIAECAASSLQDRRRKVRHAALEILAVIAQLTSNFDVLSTVGKVLDNFANKDHVLQVVRTRLSRKQLPTVEFDGSIRYATPVEPIELDWLSGTILKRANGQINNNHQSDFNSANQNTTATIRVPSAINTTNQILTDKSLTNQNATLINRNSSACSLTNQSTVRVDSSTSTTPSSSASSSTARSTNYWMHNSRHDAMCSRLPTIGQEEKDENCNDDPATNQPVIWALDPTGYSKKEQRFARDPPGVLHPVYILQPDSLPTVNGRGYRRYDRGRSFSPPSRRKNKNVNDDFRNQEYLNGKESFQKKSHSKEKESDSKYQTKDRNGYSSGSWKDMEGCADPLLQSAKFINHPGLRERKQKDTRTEEFTRDQPFRKSFSSDQLYHLEKQQEKQKSGAYKSHSYSLSSNSSTTSTGSSLRIPSYWHKDYKSGIPIPISTERLKIKTNQVNTCNNGPMIALRAFPPVTPTQLHQTAPIRQENDHHLPLPLPPRSSGSESSGYFTPPPGSGSENNPAFVKMNSEESKGFSSDEVDHATTERNRSLVPSRRNSRDFVEPYPRDKTPNYDLKDLENSNKDQSNYSAKSRCHSEELFGEQLNNNYSTEQSSVTSESNDVEFKTSRHSTPAPLILAETTNEIVPVRRKSRSVTELQNFLPQINDSGRKTTNSAPSSKNDENLRCWDIDIKDFCKTDDDVFDDIRKDVLNAQVNSEKDTKIETGIETNEIKENQGNTLKPTQLEHKISRNSSRKSIKATPSPRVTTEPILMRPFAKPKDALQLSLSQMESNEWETTIQGLQSLMRVARHHPEVVEGQIHTVCLGLAKHIKNLRSQVARSACQTVGELFVTCKRGLDMELDEIAGPLLQRTADTNKFLRADANSALDLMFDHLPFHRVIAAVTARGCSHQNAVVRAASMRLLCKLVNALGAEKIMNMPKELRDKLILAGANSLTDGNLEARHQGKAMVRVLMGYPGFQRVLNEVVPQNLLRHIAKTMATIK